MEKQVANRRLSLIASHLAAAAAADENISSTHLSPLKCSAGLNHVAARYENRMYFARQASGAQTHFMKHPSLDQKSSTTTIPTIPRCDNRMYFARQGLGSQAPFMRQASLGQDMSISTGASLGHSTVQPSISISEDLLPRTCAKIVSYTGNVVTKLDSDYCDGPPKYARPNKGIQPAQFEENPPQSIGSKWSPRMDVAETGRSYVVTVELPGSDVKDIRVEVNDQNLVVMTRGSTHWLKTGSNSKDSRSAGLPYQVAWPLPANVNKDTISAELANRILQVSVPKI